MIAEEPKLLCGDCKEVLWYLPANSVDSIVTDPPAGINFMGKEWDGDKGGRDKWIKWLAGILKSCFRLLKPGGHVLVWAIPRTSHWTATAIEDAGLEVHDVVTHIFGSGFPKSTDISKQIDKAAGAAREKIDIPGKQKSALCWGENYGERKEVDFTKPATPEAKTWDGWGTALKPAHENWILARKPVSEQNIAANVLKHGTGGINIDGCKINFKDDADKEESEGKNQHSKYKNSVMRNLAPHGIYNKDERAPEDYRATGRFPSNLVLSHHPDCEIVGKKKILGGNDKKPRGKGINRRFDVGRQGHSKQPYGPTYGDQIVNDWNCVDGCPVKELDRQSGERKSIGGSRGAGGKHGRLHNIGAQDIKPGFGDTGGASRFFYCAKPSRRERNAGLSALQKKPGGSTVKGYTKDKAQGLDRNRPVENFHPTVKAIKLMRYLCRLITPPGGIVLDPFMGSGTTGIAALQEGFRFIGIEKDPEYFKIAQARISYIPRHKPPTS